MSTFNENDVNRATDGTFASKPTSEPTGATEALTAPSSQHSPVPDGVRVFDTDMESETRWRVADGSLWVCSSDDGFESAVPYRDIKPVTEVPEAEALLEGSAFPMGGQAYLYYGEVISLDDRAFFNYDGTIYTAQMDAAGVTDRADIFPDSVKEPGYDYGQFV